ncbi:MAG: hypothetical protein HUJ94_05150 [Bacteroidales bacterium]|nr:hypothetical protein [Bacteroidales bacterium]
MKKSIILTTAALLLCFVSFGQEVRKDKLFMPKGNAGAGLQVSYIDLGSNDSDLMMLLQGINADGTYFSFAPFFTYSYRNNKALGARFRYSTAKAGVSNADLSLFSEDLSLSVENLSAKLRSYQFQVFRRSYMGLDNNGRFGLFNDLVLSYSNSRNSFMSGEDDLDAYFLAKKVKLGICPGIMIFILNNLSTHVSMSIGGVSYSHTDCIEKGEKVGKRDYMKAHFAPDVTDISFGMTFYL